jgi:hypothetical protein
VLTYTSDLRMGVTMPRPMLYDVKLKNVQVTVHPDEWRAFMALMQSRDTTASARIRRMIRAELKRANERAQT